MVEYTTVVDVSSHGFAVLCKALCEAIPFGAIRHLESLSLIQGLLQWFVKPIRFLTAEDKLNGPGDNNATIGDILDRVTMAEANVHGISQATLKARDGIHMAIEYALRCMTLLLVHSDARGGTVFSELFQSFIHTFLIPPSNSLKTSCLQMFVSSCRARSERLNLNDVAIFLYHQLLDLLWSAEEEASKWNEGTVLVARTISHISNYLFDMHSLDIWCRIFLISVRGGARANALQRFLNSFNQRKMDNQTNALKRKYDMLPSPQDRAAVKVPSRGPFALEVLDEAILSQVDVPINSIQKLHPPRILFEKGSIRSSSRRELAHVLLLI